MNSKKNSKCIVVSNKVLIFAVLKDKRINYIIKHLKIIVMKEVNFVLYFGANRGKNALNNPQTVTTHANCDGEVLTNIELLVLCIISHVC